MSAAVETGVEVSLGRQPGEERVTVTGKQHVVGVDGEGAPGASEEIVDRQKRAISDLYGVRRDGDIGGGAATRTSAPSLRKA